MTEYTETAPKDIYQHIPSGTPTPCPSCGRCPTCGRGGHNQYYPWVQPWNPFRYPNISGPFIYSQTDGSTPQRINSCTHTESS